MKRQRKLAQPLTHRIPEAPGVVLALEPDSERVERIVRPAPGSEPVGESEEVFLVNRVQHRGCRPLDDLVFESGDRKRALSAIRLRDVHSPARQRPVRSPVKTGVQVREVALAVRLVLRPCQTVCARSDVLVEFGEGGFEQVDAEMVEERRELLLLPLPCSLPYAVQRL